MGAGRLARRKIEVRPGHSRTQPILRRLDQLPAAGDGKEAPRLLPMESSS
jgi:hypothetical protein